MTTTELRVAPAPSALRPAPPAPRSAPAAPRSAPPAPALPPARGRTAPLPTLLVAIDVLGVLAAALIAGPAWGWATVLGGALLASGAVARLYRRRLQLSFSTDLPRALAAAAVAFAGTTALALVLGQDGPVLLALGATVVLFVAVTSPLRVVAFLVARRARTRLGRGERTIVLGTGRLGVDLARSMQDHPEFGLVPVGFIDLSPPAPGVVLPAPLLSGSLHEAIRREGAGVVVIAFSNATDAQIVDATITAQSHGATLLLVPRMWELYPDSADVERLRGYPLVRVAGAPTGRPGWWVKRALDRLLAALALLVFSPVIGAAALAVLLESGGPVLFRQERVGLDGRVFAVFKLRSMRPVDEAESQAQWTIAGDPRVGPVGRVLRRTSIDELPQLWNIVRGDMSLVGPRPERPGFVAEFSQLHDRYWARHRVPAGLTGLAQVNGLRGDTSIADRSRYDNYYIANWSLWLDLRILLLTVRELFRSGQH